VTTSFTPIAEVAYVEGKALQLVNWLDYKGWEVRLGAVSDADNYQRARFLGYIHQHECEDTILWIVDDEPRWRGRLAAEYTTRDAALRRLLTIQGVK
jgi:hypothetical protein